MPKRTTKYVKALEVACQFAIPEMQSHDRLYQALAEQNFYWNSDTQTWDRDDQAPDPPTNLIRVRVWADAAKVRGAAYAMKTVLEESGFELLEQSEPYTCRPPKQLEARMYLTFRQRN